MRVYWEAGIVISAIKSVRAQVGIFSSLSFAILSLLTSSPTIVEKRTCEICILAGGLSRRMGRDKARLLLGRRTMLGRIRATARATGLAVRVIRRDAVPRCGPLGGIYTALRSTRAEAVLFLACDMPFVTPELIQWVLEQSSGAGVPPASPGVSPRRPDDRRDARPTTLDGLFIRSDGVAGFPFLLPHAALPAVAAQIGTGRFSLQALAKGLEAKLVRLPRSFTPQLRNINTPAELSRAKRTGIWSAGFPHWWR